MRRTLQQLQVSGIFQSVGLCSGDLPSIAALVNEITERLLFEGGDTGFWGCWDRVKFQVTRQAPYITLPSPYCRAINLAVCNKGVRLQNEFYELMEAGIGLQPPSGCLDWCGAVEGFERGMVTTMVDLPVADGVTINPQYLRAYISDQADSGRRLLFQGALDGNGNGIYSTDPTGQVNGAYITFNYPFSTLVDSNGTPIVISGWKSIVKDLTLGDVILRAVDSVTGIETTLSRYQPWETNPAYKRYYLNNLPNSCCQVNGTSTVVNIDAVCKLEYRPVMNPTDGLILSNFPALKKEAQCIRAEDMEDPGAPARAAAYHAKAIHLLNAELTHYLGKKWPAVNFAPFGTARLERRYIGRMQ